MHEANVAALVTVPYYCAHKINTIAGHCNLSGIRHNHSAWMYKYNNELIDGVDAFMKTQYQLTISLSLFTILSSYQSMVSANGFRLPEYSAAGVASSNALVADDSRISAIAYNPAIMTTYTSSENKPNASLFSGSLVRIEYDTEVTTSTKTTQGSGKSEFDVPNLFVSNQISDKLSIGMLIHSPFGLETAWPRNTFAPFLGSAGLEPDLSRIKMFNTNFNLGYKLTSDTGIAFGINKYNLLDLQFNSHATVIKGTGGGYGWNAALISKFKKLSLGISYRSAVHAHANGTAAGVLPIELDITFPEMLTIGVNYTVSDAFKFEFDVEHTGWNVYDNLNIRKSSDQSTLTKSTNNWKNTLTYRASGQYKIHKHQILFGYAYDETPQPDAYYTARIPGADRQLFSIGYQYDFGSFQFETGLMLVKFNDRNINSTNTYVPAASTDPNGTTAYNGTYRSSATILSVGINTTF